LKKIQKSLYDRALAFRNANTFETATYEEFKKAVEKGFAFPGGAVAANARRRLKKKPKLP